MNRDFVAEALQTVVVDIGQIDPMSKRALAKAVRKGQIVKWRGCWYPVAGANWGIGSLKSCYGTPAMKDLLE